MSTIFINCSIKIKSFLNLVLGIGLLLMMSATVQSQVLLFEETFDTGGGGFDLNSTDEGGSAGTAGHNFWIVNNAYAGGTGSLICLGFPFTYTIATTADQPAGIPNSPNSSYLHTISNEAQDDNILCSSYVASDGVCFFDSSNFARMATDVDTSLSNTVTLNFWWNCGGGPTIYGEVYYSTDQGASWTLITTPQSQYNNQPTWVETSISLPVFAGQSTLRFGFRFVNSTATSATDPGFSVDYVRVEVDQVPVDLQSFSIN